MVQGVGIRHSPIANVPFILVGQDKMSDSHISEKDTDVH